MNKNDKESLNKLLENYNPKSDGLIKSKEWKKTYKNELIDFTYINTLEDFKKMGLGGVVRVFTLANDELKKGGILVKVANENNKWYALLSIPKLRYIWKIYFDNNYVFYRVPYNVYISDDTTDAFKNILDKFVNKDEVEFYTESAKDEYKDRDNTLNDIIQRYKK